MNKTAAAKQSCGTCEYGYIDELGDCICVNSDSDNCTEYVGNDDICKNWEDKNAQK
ncbi:MAG: hypothetical protein RR162_00150 [Oscillospiraceae bacterium]